MQLSDVIEKLSAPFSRAEIRIKPGATTKDKTAALAQPHVTPRAVMDRLDQAVGPDNWSFSYEPISIVTPNNAGHPAYVAIKGKLTVLGKTSEDAGEAESIQSETIDTFVMKDAVSNAFKRCAIHFGVGRYLYKAPQVWLKYDGKKFLESYPMDKLER